MKSEEWPGGVKKFPLEDFVFISGIKVQILNPPSKNNNVPFGAAVIAPRGKCWIQYWESPLLEDFEFSNVQMLIREYAPREKRSVFNVD